ncbi:MAG: hypothetical protein Q4B68_10255 [Bacteroidales bacterium]|nr:hypothetical protein [Bacteroidales bacterium]
MKKLLLLSILAVASVTASAYDFVVDSLAYSKNEGDTTVSGEVDLTDVTALVGLVLQQ